MNEEVDKEYEAKVAHVMKVLEDTRLANITKPLSRCYRDMAEAVISALSSYMD